MEIIIKYQEEYDEGGVIRIVSEEETMCPICGGYLIVIGSRRRDQKDSAGTKITLIIRRLRCQTQTCRKIHHELPDRVIPYKRHCAETVENIVNGNVDDVCCDFMTESRIRAWWIGMYAYFQSVLTSLQTKYAVVFSSNMTPREIVRAVVNANFWIHTRSALMLT